MREIPAHCTTKTSNPLIVFSEKKSRIAFENPNHNSYLAIQVDGCVFVLPMDLNATSCLKVRCMPTSISLN